MCGRLLVGERPASWRRRRFINARRGRRTDAHTNVFASKLRDATAGRFTVNTDGFESYRIALPGYIGYRIEHAVIIKQYGSPPPDEQRKYSPPSITSIKKHANLGDPDLLSVNTSYAGRLNGSMRTFVKRMCRLTYCFSKRWTNQRAALWLFFVHFNWCRRHRTLKGKTPAMVTALANRPWTIRELIENTATH